MKALLNSFMYLFLTSNLFCQTTVKLVNSETDERFTDYGFSIIDNNRITYSIGFKDQNGFYTIKKEKLDSTKTYYYYYDRKKYKRIKKKIDLNKNDTILLQLELDPNFNYEKINDSLVINNCPYYSFGQYRPFEPRNLDQINPHISSIVRKYLENKVGKEFYKNIYYSSGQVIDSTTFKKYSAKSNMNVGYYYYLGFAFSNKKNGLGKYCSYIKMDENGNILVDIKFPEQSDYINNLVNVTLVKEKVIERNFFKEKSTKIEFDYDEELNIFIWKFSNEYFNPNNTYNVDILIYNAHNGNFLEKRKEEGYWVE